MTQNHFDKAAGGWDLKQRRVELAQAIASGIASLPLVDTMTALEYGCGTGLVGLSLAPRLGSLTAMDTSSGMLEVLQEKIREMGLRNVIPRQLDLTVADCGEEFDLIFSAMTLHHIDDTQLILKKLCGMVKRGGYLAVADLDSEDGSFHSPEAGEKHHGFNRETLIAMVSGEGLSSIAIETIHTIRKTLDDGREKGFPVFLLTARK